VRLTAFTLGCTLAAYCYCGVLWADVDHWTMIGGRVCYAQVGTAATTLGCTLAGAVRAMQCVNAQLQFGVDVCLERWAKYSVCRSDNVRLHTCHCRGVHCRRCPKVTTTTSAAGTRSMQCVNARLQFGVDVCLERCSDNMQNIPYAARLLGHGLCLPNAWITS